VTAPRPFICSKCGRTSHHPEDKRPGYCGACHAFTGDLGDVDPIVTFLLARLADEELKARLAGNVKAYLMQAPRRLYLQHESGRQVDLTDLAEESFTAAAWLEHGIHQSPGRTLARVTGLRRIVLAEAHARIPRPDVDVATQQIDGDPCVDVWLDNRPQGRFTRQEFNARFTLPAPASATLKALSEAYGDHPDYQPEWHPDYEKETSDA
jgi:hypothetical protein